MKLTYNKTVIFLMSIMFISMTIALFSLIGNICKFASKISQNECKILTSMVQSAVQDWFVVPMTVSETMSDDYNLKRYLDADEFGSTPFQEDTIAYLKSIRTSFNYQQAFAVSEKSKAYYTANGISKFIDEKYDTHDVWYTLFKESGRLIDLDVDTDEANDLQLSVFVNKAVFSDYGEFLGVCGVGFGMSEFQKLLNKIEQQNGIKVYLVDPTGLIQIASDNSLIETTIIEDNNIAKLDSSNYFCEQTSKKTMTTSYLSELDWFLILKYDSPAKVDILKIVLPSLIIFLFGTFLIILTLAITAVVNKRLRKLSLHDELTNLLNRHSYEMDSKVIANNGLDGISIIPVDINALKATNDTLGHKLGDELIKGTANALIYAFSDYARIYRIGGDEFMVILKSEKSQIDECINKLNDYIKKWNENSSINLSVSKSVVSSADYPNMNFDELKDLADKKMYEDKTKYYERTGNDRRQSRR